MIRDSNLIFGDYTLVRSQFALYRGDQEVRVAPLAIRLITFLADNRDRTVPVEEIRTELWGDVTVGDSSLHQVLKLARRATGDSGTEQRVIRTIRGLGFRFVARVRIERPSAADASTGIVGREDLLADLKNALEAAVSGSAQLILISGEPGIGKSRITDEIARAAIECGARVGRANGLSPNGTPAYWTWTRLFRDLSRPTIGGGDPVDPTFSQLLEGHRHSDSLIEPTHDGAERFRIFDSVSQDLHRISAESPLVLILEDLHGAEESSLQLLSFVANELGTSRILLVGTFRTAEMLRDEHRARILSETARASQATSLVLSPLNSVDTEELIRQHLTVSLRPDVVERAIDRSGGNPYFAIEIARLLSRRSQEECNQIHPADLDEILPVEILPLLGGHLLLLSEPARHVIKTAALLGRLVSISTLSDIESRHDVPRSLSEAVDAGLVVASNTIHTDESLSFVHDLIRDALLAEISSYPDDEKARHLRIAESLIKSPRPDGSAIAYHLGSAAPLGDLARTIDYLRRAGEQSISRQDEGQAWRFLRRALDLIHGETIGGPRLRCDLLIAAGEVAMRGTRTDEAKGLLRNALKIAREHGFADAFCRAARALAYRDEILGMPEPDVAQILEEAIDHFSEDAPEHRPRVLSALAVKLRYEQSGLDRSIRLSDEAVALAREAGDAAALARVLEDASFIHWSVAEPEGWIELNHQIVEAATEAGDIALQFRGAKGLATGFMEIGDRDGMEREMARCAELAKTAPAPYLKGVCALHKGAIALLDGPFEDAEQHAIQAARSGLSAITPLSAVQIFFHRLQTGRLAELEGSTRDLVKANPGVAAWAFALARILADQGREAETSAQLRAAGRLTELPRDRNWLAAGAMGVEAAILIGDQEICLELLASLKSYSRVNVVLGHGALFYGNTGYFVGRLLQFLGQTGEAKRYLLEAHDMHRRMRSDEWIRRSQQALSALAEA